MASAYPIFYYLHMQEILFPVGDPLFPSKKVKSEGGGWEVGASSLRGLGRKKYRAMTLTGGEVNLGRKECAQSREHLDACTRGQVELFQMVWAAVGDITPEKGAKRDERTKLWCKGVSVVLQGEVDCFNGKEEADDSQTW